MNMDPTEYRVLAKAIAKAAFILHAEQMVEDKKIDLNGSKFDPKEAAEVFEDCWKLEDMDRSKYERFAGYVIQTINGEL